MKNVKKKPRGSKGWKRLNFQIAKWKYPIKDHKILGWAGGPVLNHSLFQTESNAFYEVLGNPSQLWPIEGICTSHKSRIRQNPCSVSFHPWEERHEMRTWVRREMTRDLGNKINGTYGTVTKKKYVFFFFILSFLWSKKGKGDSGLGLKRYPTTMFKKRNTWISVSNGSTTFFL